MPCQVGPRGPLPPDRLYSVVSAHYDCTLHARPLIPGEIRDCKFSTGSTFLGRVTPTLKYLYGPAAKLQRVAQAGRGGFRFAFCCLSSKKSDIPCFRGLVGRELDSLWGTPRRERILPQAGGRREAGSVRTRAADAKRLRGS